ncbi:MAG: DEAD/DEAH box helicase, partial [Chitinophagaceae bacterium]
MKLLDLQFGENISGIFRVDRVTPDETWLDQICQLRPSDGGKIELDLPKFREKLPQIFIIPESVSASQLVDSFSSGMIVMGCVMSIDKKYIEICYCQFTSPTVTIPKSLQITISDEFIDQYVARYSRKTSNFKQATEWLKHQFLLDGFGYWLVTQGASNPSSEGGFSVLGKSFRLDLSRKTDGELYPKRLVKLNNRNSSPEFIYLISEPLEFTDKTIANIAQSAIINGLTNALKSENSWINSWRAYNDEEQRIIEERFSTLPDLHYDSFSYEDEEPKIRFNLSHNAVLSQWQKKISQEGLTIKIIPEKEVKEIQFSSKVDGIAIECNPRSLQLIVNWTSNNRPLDKGFIRPSTALENSRIKTRNRALDNLEKRQVQLPTLSLILEGKPIPKVLPRREKKNITQSAKKLFGGTPTSAQEKALKIALTTPDIALIQGPPGTGKTKVIQALLTLLTEGQRSEEVFESILVTSFQHEAVDNAIAGMKVSGLPVDRLGGQKGEDRGQALFDAWSEQVIQDVQKNIPRPQVPRRVLVERLEDLVSHWRKAPSGRDSTQAVLEQFRDLTVDFLCPERRIELEKLLLARTQTVSSMILKPVIEDEDDRVRLEKLLGKQCLTQDTFLENGSRQARSLKRFLEQYIDELSADQIEAVDVASDWDPEKSTNLEPWISLQAACQGIVDRLLKVPEPNFPQEQNIVDPEVERCLLSILADLKNMQVSSEEKVYEILELFVRSLQEEKDKVREEIRQYASIRAVSCGQADSARLGMKDTQSFSLVIVDEAARANPLDLLIPMVKGRRIILVGDHKQLPHVLEREIEKSLASQGSEKLEEVYRKSLFERLWESLEKQSTVDNIQRTVRLVDQFRMHPVIGKFVSESFYADCLNSSYVKAEDRINVTNLYDNKPVAWLDVPIQEGSETRRGSSSWSRQAEVKRILKELKKVLPTLNERYPEIDPSQPQGMIGIITFYSGQEDAFQQALEDPQNGIPDNLRKRVRVGTVDAFQGREYDIVYLSTVRSNQNQDIQKRLGFTALPNRLCVAFSRA